MRIPGSWFIPRQKRIGRHDSSSSSDNMRACRINGIGMEMEL